ncbi:periplasmic binding protein [Shewanella baltica OS195]|uniref:Periplasmic binding protein n=1 Tax=Shewanella baltica (strain OS195) TaxID=399599 RepID=A9L021_SHEB9|nr:siderophore ABC transporter substrate-binding protein [Shewanella baltica]ABX50629.1 periplasmic binding protein [Shewanella baltica OS195]ADT95620.1 periplasmic binding protein [Shewanella baltica OS678]
MTSKCKSGTKVMAILLFSSAFLLACDNKSEPVQKTILATSDTSESSFTPVEITHKLGTTVITKRPVRVAALDMNEVDYLEQLDIPIIGMPKDFVPYYLQDYSNNNDIVDLGAIVQPNMERIYALKPDLVLMSSIQANHYQALSNLAPTIHLDIDYQDSNSDYFDIVKQHLLVLGKVFDKQALAKHKVDELESKLQNARKVIQDRPEKALVVLHNNGAFRFLGIRSRYGFIYSGLGVKPASLSEQMGLHGQPVSSEFILENNPDIIYVVDRTAVMERSPVLDKQSIDNPLLRETNAWKTGNIIFVDPEAWYITGAGITSLNIIIDDVLKGYVKEPLAVSR